MDISQQLGFSSRTELNEIIKNLWNIDDRISKRQYVSLKEKEFFNAHLSLIKDYYNICNAYWQRTIKVIEKI